MSLVDDIAELLAVGDLDAANALVASAQQPVDKALGSAQLALARQDVQAGMQHAKKALELGAGAPGHHFLAAAKLYAGDAAGAIDEARKAVGLDPSAKSRTSLGGVLLATGRYDDAIAVLKQAVAEAPDNADARMSLGAASAKT